MSSGQVWTVLNPVSLVKVRMQTAKRERKGSGRAIGFLSNRKPGTDEFQQIVGEKLVESGYAAQFYQKPRAGASAGEELLDRIAEECVLAVTGTGD